MEYVRHRPSRLVRFVFRKSCFIGLLSTASYTRKNLQSTKDDTYSNYRCLAIGFDFQELGLFACETAIFVLFETNALSEPAAFLY